MNKQRGLSKITLKPDEIISKITGSLKEIPITEFPKLYWKYFYENKLIFKEGKPLEKK